ncbi:MAG: hypothetical protein ACRDK3_01785 [Actinomycetota bacterium]
MTDRLPDEVTSFVLQHVHSVRQLELLLDLHNHHAREVTVEVVSRAHSLRDEQAAALLEDLARRGLLTKSDEGEQALYKYEPRTKELGHQVTTLAKVYPTYRDSVISLIFSRPSESVRSFADAFRLRKDENDG